MSAAGFGVLVLALPIFLAAASLSRLYVDNGRLGFIVAALCLYSVGNVLMVRLMRDIGLGAAISLSTVAQLILVNVIAFAVFNERPAPLQLLGIGFGIVAVALIVVPKQP